MTKSTEKTLCDKLREVRERHHDLSGVGFNPVELCLEAAEVISALEAENVELRRRIGAAPPNFDLSAEADQDTLDGVLFRLWCRAASYPGGWPSRLAELFNEEAARDGFATPNSYRRALLRLAREKGVNLPVTGV